MFLESSLPHLGPLAALDRAISRSERSALPIPKGPQLEAKHEWPAYRGGRFRNDHAAGHLGPQVDISTVSGVTRRAVTCDGIAAELVETTRNFEYWMKAPVHLLAVCDHGVRRAGETFVEGLPRSDLRDLTGRMSFVPAGHEYREWHEPQGLTRTVFLYFRSSQVAEPRRA
jgi:AraC family transcriptional regulator